MPLAPVTGPDREEIDALLRRLEGVGRSHELEVSCHVEPARSAARCLVQLAAETQADMIVLALPTDRPDELLEIADEVRALSPCEVMVATQPSGRAVHATAASVS
jgi:hypothetical protein